MAFPGMDWEPLLAPLPVDEPIIENLPYSPPWGTAIIAILMASIFVFQISNFSSSCIGSTTLGACTVDKLRQYHPVVGVLGFSIIHGNMAHFLSNFLPIVLLGVAFEQEHSGFSILTLFIFSAQFSIFSDISISVAAGSPEIAIGASGATRAVAGFLLVQYFTAHSDTYKISLPEPTTISDYLIDSCLLLAPIFAVILFATTIGEIIGIIEIAPNTAIFAHVSGTMVGIVTGLYARLSEYRGQRI